MTPALRDMISTEMETIRDPAEDETSSIHVLNQQLEKAKEFHKQLEELQGYAFNLCSDIEDWIQQES